MDDIDYNSYCTDQYEILSSVMVEVAYAVMIDDSLGLHHIIDERNALVLQRVYIFELTKFGMTWGGGRDSCLATQLLSLIHI